MSAPRPLRSGAALVAAIVVGVVLSAAAQAAPGDLDPTFSGDGKQTTNLGFGAGDAAATLRQPDGKIVAVGRGGAGGGDFALARYNPNGTLDKSFSGDGRQTTDFGGFGGSDDRASGVALQADGKIVAVGHGGPGGTGNDFALARYNPNGSLDKSFSGDGKQTTDFGGDNDEAAGVALQADGKIIAVGFTQNFGAPGNFALARYNPNGTLDTRFSGDGRQTTDFGGSDGAGGVALQPDGKIIAVGFGGAGGDFALARYNPNGSLDTSFSGDGRQTTDFGGSDQAHGVALQADGKVVAVGGDGNDFAFARYNPNGSLDPSFSGDGRQTTGFGGSDDRASGVALQADGKIVAVGGDGNDFALARYNPNGSLDTSFSGDGKQTTNLGFGAGDAAATLRQPDGKIVAVGNAGNDFALARYKANGSLDKSFSGDGRQTTNFGGLGDVATGVALQGDGKIVAVGSGGPGEDFALARYNANGSLDTTFSGDGKQTTDFGGGRFPDIALGAALQANGKIVAVGGGAGDWALARYNPNGSLDKSFSGDGKQTTVFGGFGGSDDRASGVALQADGKIVAVGDGGPGGGGFDFALARYNPNGSLDTSFSGDGKQTTDFGGDFDRASGVALQGDGKIVAVGVGFGGAGGDFALARYKPSG
jgi:uncharacterized delta-60 repeat protein